MKLQSVYMKLKSRLSARISLLAATSCLVCLSALAQTPGNPVKLLYNDITVNGNTLTAPYQLGDLGPGKLLDGNVDSKYHSPDEREGSNVKENIGEQYLEVTFKDPLTLADDEDLVVYIQRCNDCDNRQPTVFRVKGLLSDATENPTADMETWGEDFCRVYFLYRGKSTKEYSARIHPEKDHSYKKLRFYVTANNTRSYDKQGHHSMGLSEFQIYIVKRDDYYPEPMADQFHYRDDYNRAYEDYTFVHTMGWLDERNRDIDATTDNQPAWRVDKLNNEAYDKGSLKGEGNYEGKGQTYCINKLNNWAEWGRDWSANGEWNLDQEQLLELGVEMPSLAPIKNDPEFDPSVIGKHQVQPTHVTEHILYALPGDPIILIPYGNFAAAPHFEKYEVNFAHWYDYRTGDKITIDDGNGNVTNLLDFLADAWGVCTSEKNGFYGAYLLSEKKVGNDIHLPGLQSKNYGMFATFFCPRDPFTLAGEAHALPFRDIDKKKNDNDINEFIIAADFSQSFNKGRNLKTDAKELIEPNIAFRHIFKIRDAKEFAEDFSGSAENNKNYVRRNRRDITARAKKDFQIGLDVSVPKPWDKGGRWRSVPSEYYYKISKSDYRRINAMRLRVTNPDGKVTNIQGDLLWENKDDPWWYENSLFYFGEPYEGLGERDYGGANYKISGGGVADDKGIYYRMLKTHKKLNGKYKVEIIGQEIIGEQAPSDIMLYNPPTTDSETTGSGSTDSGTALVVMEFDIDFVASEDETTTTPKAILVSSEKLHTNDKFKSFRESEMIKRYGEAKDKIDFDYYRGLETLDNWNQYLDARVTGSKHYQFRWPAAWSKSQYANGYSNDHNYNMYVVANHTSRTPYHNFWHENWDHEDDEAESYKNPTKGLYDRLNDKTTRLNAVDKSVAVQNGYFLYVNAASDPGVMVTLNVDKLCTGSTIHVSAWVAELSKEEEMANIVFNFVAVLENGDRVNLHSFVSGYVPRNFGAGNYANPQKDTENGGPGQWMNISYSFNPDVTRFDAGQINHYELELENNCKSSSGADYAIDDISVYIVSPVVGAEQESPLCTDTNNENAENIVRIETPFTETLQAIDVAEAVSATDGKALKLQYVILDRAKFDKAYEAAVKDLSNDNPGKTAYEAEEVIIGSGTVAFNSYAGLIKNYDEVPGTKEAGLVTDPERGVRMLAFKTLFEDSKFRIGKEYYISLYVSEEQDPIVADWTQFDIYDPCSKYCVFKVKGKNNLRVDGEIREQNGEISVCEGESPTISIDIATSDDSKTYVSAYCDWFLGTREEYDAIEEGEMDLYKAMTYFRDKYPTASSPEAEGVVANDKFTEDMLQFILKHSDKLLFYANSYKFPAIKIPEGEDTADDVVLVLPIPQVENEEAVTVCTAPMEVRIHADLHSPKVLHGLRSGITYPEDMENVPLRIGLDQLDRVTVETDAEITSDNALLIIPIRTVETSGVVTDVKAMSKKSDVILLESTNDPNYDMEPQIKTSDSGEEYVVLPEYIAGKICSFKAQIEGTENSLGAVFYDDFIFREGYEYTFSYVFKEAVGAVDADVKLCDGRTYFTIKVVPEYLVWTGKAAVSEGSGAAAEAETGVGVNRNWNNDRNWKRVASEDLYADLTADEVKKRLADKVTDGSNDNIGAYVPMEFTKVIIPATEVDAPFMYEFVKGESEVDALAGDEKAGKATELIEYDMVAKTGENSVNCDVWYANTCQEIHFLPNASIMNQQYLNYEKAWVDLELNPYRWYTLAMPLRKVFAGEFYLPSANGKQETELFQSITYDENLNHRFKPAVFQRGWDKSKATTYCPDKSEATAVIKANWSHVYNDVEESYGSGTGFSIKVDMTAVDEAKKNGTKDNSETETVLFRLPKADTFYDYYDVEGKLLNPDNQKPINHGDDHYKLNPEEGTITAETAGEGAEGYFLVGNPFMTYLNMAKFLSENSDLIEQKYWLVSKGSQKAAVFDETADGFVGDAPGYVAPMQGFFVQAKDGAAKAASPSGKKLELSYNAGMMADASVVATADVNLTTRSFSDGWKLSVTAENDGEDSSTAVVILDEFAAKGAEADLPVLDNSDLDVRATVYTVGDGKALSVNNLETLDRVELGLIALPEEETVLRFGVDEGSKEVMLLDTQTGEFTRIYDGMTYNLTGNASGRLYLTAAKDMPMGEESLISWSTSGNEVTVTSGVAAESGLSVKVYDYAGRCVVAKTTDGSELQFGLAPGVYVLQAEAGKERLCVQIKI